MGLSLEEHHQHLVGGSQPCFPIVVLLLLRPLMKCGRNCDPEMQLKTSSKYAGVTSQTVNMRKENINILLVLGEYGEKNQFLQETLLGKQYSFLDLLLNCTLFLCVRFTTHEKKVSESQIPLQFKMVGTSSCKGKAAPTKPKMQFKNNTSSLTNTGSLGPRCCPCL